LPDAKGHRQTESVEKSKDFWEFVLSADASGQRRNNNWCPEEDSNLHASRR
jgi:hypothetical protein